MDKRVERIHNKIKIMAHEQRSYKLQSLYNHLSLHDGFILNSLELGFDEDWIVLQLVKYGSWELVNDWWGSRQHEGEFRNAKDYE